MSSTVYFKRKKNPTNLVLPSFCPSFRKLGRNNFPSPPALPFRIGTIGRGTSCVGKRFLSRQKQVSLLGAKQKFTTIRFVELAHKSMCEKNVRWKILERKELLIKYFWVLEMAQRAISNVGFFGDSRPWMLFLKLSRIVGVSRSAIPKTIMQVQAWKMILGISMISMFFVRGLYVSTGTFHRGGNVKHLKFSGYIGYALETTALPPMRKPEMEGWRSSSWLFTFCVKAPNDF